MIQIVTVCEQNSNVETHVQLPNQVKERDSEPVFRYNSADIQRTIVIRLVHEFRKAEGCTVAQAASRRPLNVAARSSISNQCTWDLWWKKWRWGKFLTEYFFFPSQYHSTNASYQRYIVSTDCVVTEREISVDQNGYRSLRQKELRTASHHSRS
jgi:hypothetical protein